MREWSTITINHNASNPHSHPFPTFSTSKVFNAQKFCAQKTQMTSEFSMWPQWIGTCPPKKTWGNLPADGTGMVLPRPRVGIWLFRALSGLGWLGWFFLSRFGGRETWPNSGTEQHGELDDLPSGEHTKSYGKWPFIVDFPIKHGDFPWQNVSSPEGKHLCICRSKCWSGLGSNIWGSQCLPWSVNVAIPWETYPPVT